MGVHSAVIVEVVLLLLFVMTERLLMDDPQSLEGSASGVLLGVMRIRHR